MQVFLRAADVAVYPYRHILTSGSLLLALSFGVPAVVPAVGMTRELMDGQEAGLLYEAMTGATGLEAAIRQILSDKDAGHLPRIAANARALAETQIWPRFEVCTG